jgi:murein DD-endopeptidase MepM/ murein hydrolase activator NlpD
VAEAVLRPYGQIVFSRDLGSGLLVLLAVAVFPSLLAATLVAVGVAAAVTLALGLGVPAVRQGSLGCLAVLTTLGLGVFLPEGGHPAVLVALGAVLAVLFGASFEAVFAGVALPTHALPFVAATYTVHLAARVLPASEASFTLLQPWSALGPQALAPSWLDVPAALVFLHGGAAGLLVIAAIALYSRIALALAALGAGVAVALHAALRGAVPWSGLDTTAAFNAVLAAIAVGGVWFVPQRSSFALGAGAAAVACVISYALTPVMGRLALPVLSLPFVVTTHLLLTAVRRREHDRAPRSAVPGERPEETLATHLHRVRRFGDALWLPFRLPFRGEWVVTQGHDGAHTHQGPWRHGLDFEVAGPEGGLHARGGVELRDYRCYGLPVLAAGAGTVALVVDGVPDNRPGTLNLDDRWGNAVVVAHGIGLYSVYAHLQPGSLRVKPGEAVLAGAELGRCGASGRAARPHLHFQVQRIPTLGSATIPVDFGDVVTSGGEVPHLHRRMIPAEQDRVRPVVRDEALARALGFAPGASYELLEATTGRRETARVEVDLLGRRRLRSTEASLVVDPYDSGLVILELLGDPRSLLRDVLLALARVPFDQASALAWRDALSHRLLLPRWLRPLVDLTAVIAPRLGDLTIAYALRRTAGQVEIEGVAEALRTRAVIDLGAGPHRIEVERRGVRSVIELRPVPAGPGPVGGDGATPEAA